MAEGVGRRVARFRRQGLGARIQSDLPTAGLADHATENERSGGQAQARILNLRAGVMEDNRAG